PSGRPREQQIRDMRAGDQQDGTNGSEQDEKGGSRIRNYLIMQPPQRYAPAPRLRILLLDSASDSVHFRLCLRQARGAFEACDGVIVMHLSAVCKGLDA